MTNRTTIQDFCCKDAKGYSYGIYRYKEQRGSNWATGEPKNAPHNYSCRASYRFGPTGRINYLNGYQFYEGSTIKFNPSFKTPDKNYVYIKAINKLYGDVKGSDFNAAVSAAEMNQSLRMIGDNARRIYRAQKALRRGDFREASRQLGMKSKSSGSNAASHWLELQYGWMPLLKDVHEAGKLISYRMSDPKLPRFRVRAQESYDGKRLPSGNDWGLTSVTQRCQLIYYPKAHLTLPEALGLTDPEIVLWEKLPYSFVVDWFLPIGPWIEAATAVRKLTGMTIRTDTTISIAMYSQGNSTERVVSGGESTYWRDVDMQRSVGLLSPPKLPDFRPLEKALSVRHTLNGLALLANLKSSQL